MLVKQRARGRDDATWVACRTVRQIIMRSTVQRFVLGAVQTGRLASAVTRQSRVQATLACTTTVYPYSSPVSPDVDVCCIAGWRLMFEIMRTGCLSSGRHTSTDNIISGVIPTKYIGPILIRPNAANIAQYPISQYQYHSNPSLHPPGSRGGRIIADSYNKLFS